MSTGGFLYWAFSVGVCVLALEVKDLTLRDVKDYGLDRQIVNRWCLKVFSNTWACFAMDHINCDSGTTAVSLSQNIPEALLL